MSAGVRGLGQGFAGNFNLDVGQAEARQSRNDAQMGIQELKVLRLDVDMVAPPEAAELAEPLVQAYRGEISTGDQLRLPQMTRNDGPSMRAAVNRVLATDTQALSTDSSAVVKEERMLRVLRALDYAVDQISQKSNSAHIY